MEGEDSWRCSECGARRSAKAAHFTALPPLLMLQLKRFVFDMNKRLSTVSLNLESVRRAKNR